MALLRQILLGDESYNNSNNVDDEMQDEMQANKYDVIVIEDDDDDDVITLEDEDNNDDYNYNKKSSDDKLVKKITLPTGPITVNDAREKNIPIAKVTHFKQSPTRFNMITEEQIRRCFDNILPHAPQREIILLDIRDQFLDIIRDIQYDIHQTQNDNRHQTQNDNRHQTQNDNRRRGNDSNIQRRPMPYPLLQRFRYRNYIDSVSDDSVSDSDGVMEDSESDISM
ncbi:hypothetical protein Hesp007 [Hemileuca sp. nucleopolyhedrovirus]|uniref:Uncharacterized protein n=1 Tax=Hemileuca sp. nucleopolyhedrovirus TaxID=1367203 RepID=S5MQ75_9ABAC|nr:hypothetical protein Hesp007 [Hemileuca sp. nucleopolyhedrovirus]AGR56759.1 hypothetical protein Hesp007 [Hemileuca sp. nucleopolyhedrovirus]